MPSIPASTVLPAREAVPAINNQLWNAMQYTKIPQA